MTPENGILSLDEAVSRPSLLHRASKKCLRVLRKASVREMTRPDDKSSISGRSSASRSSFRSSFSKSSLFTTRTVEEDDYMALDQPLTEEPIKEEAGSDGNTMSEEPNNEEFTQQRSSVEPRKEHHQGQSSFFRQMPPEIRHQIYQHFWVSAGVQRHAFLSDRKLLFSPCVTDHEAPDERQIGVAKDFETSSSTAEVQPHPKWFKRMTSPWCNHWKCERLWEDIRDGREIDGNKKQAYMSLLLSCKRIYNESVESFRDAQTLTITDGQTLHRILRWPRPKYLNQARRFNISLREDSGNFLYLNGASLWHTLSDPDSCPAERIYLWLDAECPVTRRLLPEFRELFSSVPNAVAPRLTIDFPCDAEDGFWAWEEVDVEGPHGDVKRLAPLVPKFTVVARGRQRFNETSSGYVSSVDRGRPRRRLLRSSNPFEDILLYGRGFVDGSYV
ncbi:hypothetical protein CORC01_13557 [Colletotrichum orchidophilum]|uniref:DUF7730 domain-containing protein n=1 Tax=Colletotrichum orchidophilum TaxID=1209926 RepID=A0A1G4APW1_9PEZI|nr:uncharacterized protein CORC01_13557 [Colletotrichum orchidophilum]OHE91146.1 hypothetical protein CORC01_13557 [Colletotrichum orchidophilum]